MQNHSQRWRQAAPQRPQPLVSNDLHKGVLATKQPVSQSVSQPAGLNPAPTPWSCDPELTRVPLNCAEQLLRFWCSRMLSSRRLQNRKPLPVGAESSQRCV